MYMFYGMLEIRWICYLLISPLPFSTVRGICITDSLTNLGFLSPSGVPDQLFDIVMSWQLSLYDLWLTLPFSAPFTLFHEYRRLQIKTMNLLWFTCVNAPSATVEKYFDSFDWQFLKTVRGSAFRFYVNCAYSNISIPIRVWKTYFD